VTPKRVFRGDARDPQLIFKMGFQVKVKEGNLDLNE